MDDGWRGLCKFCNDAVFWHGDGDDEAIDADDNWNYYHVRCLPKGQRMPDIKKLYWRLGGPGSRLVFAIVEQEDNRPIPGDNDIFLAMFEDGNVAHYIVEAHNMALYAEHVGGLTPRG